MKPATPYVCQDSARGALILDDNFTNKKAKRCIRTAIAGHRASIKQHQASIRTLASQLNDLSYIYRLPPEILCDIFLLAQRDHSGTMLQHPVWTKVTHVSRYLRDVAINCPRLWATPPLGNYRWLKEGLKRSMNLTLELNIMAVGPHHHEYQALKLITGHGAPISHLSIVANFVNFNEGQLIFGPRDIHMKDFFPVIVPQLEFLHLYGIRHPGPYPLENESLISMSDVILHEAAPLRSVRLAYCTIIWGSPLIFQHSLVELTLEHLMGKSRPTANQFVLSMNEVPNLRILTLTNTFLFTRPPSSDLTSTIGQTQCHLSHLEAISLRSGLWLDIETFFELITFPANAVVKITYDVPKPQFIDDPDPKFSNFLSLLGQSYCSRFHTAAFVEPENALDGADIRGIRLKFFTDTFSDEELCCNTFSTTDANFELYLLYTIHHLWYLRPDASLVTDFFGESTLIKEIRCVYINTEQLSRDVRLIETLGRLPELETIVTGRYNSKNFTNELNSLFIRELKGRIDYDEYFPMLTSVYLLDIRIIDGESDRNSIAVEVDQLRCLIDYYKLRGVILRPIHGLGRTGDRDVLDFDGYI